MAKTTKGLFYSQHAHYLSWLPYNVLYIEMVKLITFNVESKENIALKGRLSNATTITKQINAIKEEIALTMKS